MAFFWRCSKCDRVATFADDEIPECYYCGFNPYDYLPTLGVTEWGPLRRASPRQAEWR